MNDRTPLTDVYRSHLEVANASPYTIEDRLEVLARLARFMGMESIENASAADLCQFQRSFAHLAPASRDIYTRHVQAFFLWAVRYGHLSADPSAAMVKIKVPKGVPHPINNDDLKKLITCTSGPLHTAYILAAFAGLRCEEITKLQAHDLDLASDCPTAFVHGKGGKTRRAPLVVPLVDELTPVRAKRKGWLLLGDDGRPYSSRRLSTASNRQMASLGIDSTLHSLRHWFATNLLEHTRDILLVRDLLGHETLQSTEIYTKSSSFQAHQRMGAFANSAARLLGRRHLEIVHNN